MLCSAKTNALRAVLHGICRIGRGVRIGAHLKLAVLVCPLHNPSEVSAHGSLNGLDIAFINLTSGAVQRNVIALTEYFSAQFKYFLLLVDRDLATAGYARRTHAARHDCRMGGHATAHGKNTFRRMHTLDILRGSLKTHKHDSLAFLMCFLRLVCRKVNLTCRRAGRSGKCLSHYLSCFQSVGIEGRM